MAQYENVDSRGPGKPYSSKSENAEVAAPGPALACMQEELALIKALLGGTIAMRLARHDYLPQHDYETNTAYDKRVRRSYLDNYTLRTLNTLVGKAFKEPPSPGQEMDESLVTFMDDVDGAGTGFVPFARKHFRAGVEQAVSYILVDAPAEEVKPEGTVRTKADDAKANRRPVWKHIRQDDMLDYQEDLVPGHGIKPTLVRYRDDYIEQNGLFGSTLVECVKVITGAEWEQWERRPGPRGGKQKWLKVDGGALTLGFVPCVPFYTDKVGPGEGRSPLADLGHLNVRHWQSTSDQVNILTVCRFPILAGSGIRNDEGADGGATSVVVGPNKFISTPDPQGKIYWVEHTGAAVEAGVGELERLEQAMASYGAEFLKKGAQGPETASGRVLDAGEAISPLQSWGLDFRDALMVALSYTALMMGMDPTKVNVVVDFEIEEEVNLADGSELTALDQARTRRDISRKAHLEELKRRGILSEDYDIDEDEDEIGTEPPPPGTGLDGMSAGLGGGKPPVKKKPSA